MFHTSRQVAQFAAEDVHGVGDDCCRWRKQGYAWSGEGTSNQPQGIAMDLRELQDAYRQQQREVTDERIAVGALIRRRNVTAFVAVK